MSQPLYMWYHSLMYYDCEFTLRYHSVGKLCISTCIVSTPFVIKGLSCVHYCGRVIPYNLINIFSTFHIVECKVLGLKE